MNSFHPTLKELKYYCCPLLSPRKKYNQSLGLEIVGTGVLLLVAGQRFLVTASHVANIAMDHDLLYAKSDDEASVFKGTIIRMNVEAKNGLDQLDNLDLAVFYLEDNLIHSQYEFLNGEHVSPNEKIPHDIRCIITGYPIGKNKTKAKSIFVNAKQVAWEFSTIDTSEYNEYELSPDLNLAIRYDRKVITESGQKVRPPKMNGMSGGAMWIDTGSGFVLTGIVTYQITEKRIVFGTRIAVAISAINEYLNKH